MDACTSADKAKHTSSVVGPPCFPLMSVRTARSLVPSCATSPSTLTPGMPCPGAATRVVRQTLAAGYSALGQPVRQIWREGETPLCVSCWRRWRRSCYCCLLPALTLPGSLPSTWPCPPSSLPTTAPC